MAPNHQPGCHVPISVSTEAPVPRAAAPVDPASPGSVGRDLGESCRVPKSHGVFSDFSVLQKDGKRILDEEVSSRVSNRFYQILIDSNST